MDERISTSGQPREGELAVLARIGVRWAVNLGLHSHEQALPDEAGTVARLDMRYVHIPVDFQTPRDENFQAFCGALAACGDEMVHVHSIINDRVSAFSYRYQRDVLGMDENTARLGMEQIWRPEGVWAAFVA